jgi:hypothetical protein
MVRTCQQIGCALMMILVIAGTASAEDLIDVPYVDGSWWQVAPNAPDVGQWSTGQGNACDFAILRSADGKWHCIACIRGTSHFGDRLFYRWEAEHLTDSDWRPCGVFNVPRGKRGKPLEFISLGSPGKRRPPIKSPPGASSGMPIWPAEDTPTVVNKMNCVRDSGRFDMSHLAACEQESTVRR